MDISNYILILLTKFAMLLQKYFTVSLSLQFSSLLFFIFQCLAIKPTQLPMLLRFLPIISSLLFKSNPFHIIPCCCANKKIDIKVLNLSPFNEYECVNPADILFFHPLFFQISKVESINFFIFVETFPKYVGLPIIIPSLSFNIFKFLITKFDSYLYTFIFLFSLIPIFIL